VHSIAGDEPYSGVADLLSASCPASHGVRSLPFETKYLYDYRYSMIVEV